MDAEELRPVWIDVEGDACHGAIKGDTTEEEKDENQIGEECGEPDNLKAGRIILSDVQVTLNTLPADLTPFIRQAQQMTQESARQPTNRQFMLPKLSRLVPSSIKSM